MSILNQPFDSGPGLGRGPSLRVPPASAVEGATGLPVGLHFRPWEQIFYGEFDGRRRKRVLVKIIGE